MEDSPDSRPPTILAIDDTPANLRLLASMLRKAGWIVVTADNGGPGITAARNERPDLILLDIIMEDMSGYEVCDRLKADERIRDIPVIMISSLSEVMDKIRAFSLGAVDYITKSFQREEVLARVRTHLDLQRMQRGLRVKNRQLRKEVAERRRIEEALNRLNLELEDRVAQRTVRLRTEIVSGSYAQVVARELPLTIRACPGFNFTVFGVSVRRLMSVGVFLCGQEARGLMVMPLGDVGRAGSPGGPHGRIPIRTASVGVHFA